MNIANKIERNSRHEIILLPRPVIYVFIFTKHGTRICPQKYVEHVLNQNRHHSNTTFSSANSIKFEIPRIPNGTEHQYFPVWRYVLICSIYFYTVYSFWNCKKNKSLNSRWAKLTNEINCMMYQFLEQNPGGTKKSTDAIPVVHAKVVPNVSAFGKVFVPYFDWFSLIHITGLQRWISTYGI